MTYKGIKITMDKDGDFRLFSPVNGTLRIFDTLERAKYYIDHAEDLDSRARAMRD